MKSVIVRLQEYEKHASNAEKKFVEFLLKHPEQAVGCSIHKLAEMTFCSVSTIVRLCQKTGFDGYKELQRSLMYELAIRKENSQIQLQEISQQDSLEELVNKVTYKNIGCCRYRADYPQRSNVIQNCAAWDRRYLVYSLCNS